MSLYNVVLRRGGPQPLETRLPGQGPACALGGYASSRASPRDRRRASRSTTPVDGLGRFRTRRGPCSPVYNRDSRPVRARLVGPDAESPEVLPRGTGRSRPAESLVRVPRSVCRLRVPETTAPEAASTHGVGRVPGERVHSGALRRDACGTPCRTGATLSRRGPLPVGRLVGSGLRSRSSDLEAGTSYGGLSASVGMSTDCWISSRRTRVRAGFRSHWGNSGLCLAADPSR